MTNFNIAQLVLPSKSAEFKLTGFGDFKVTLNHLSKSELARIRENSLVTKMDEETGIPYTDLDKDKYLDNYAEKAILGWTGLTGHVLSKLVLIDEDRFGNLDEEVDFSVTNAVSLLDNSKIFDTWVSQTLGKLDNFRK
jgi:hypothetical protein